MTGKLLAAMRRTIIPLMWAIFRRSPAGLKFWSWAVQVLRVQSRPNVTSPQAAQRRLNTLARSMVAPPTVIPLCKVGNLPEFYDSEWLSVARDLGMGTTDLDRISKKYWEYVHVIYGLKQLGQLTPSAKVLSVGCGFEIPMFYLANHVERVFGIDLFDGAPDVRDSLEHPERYASFPVRPGHIKLQKMDGRYLAFADESFDIVYSLSSIEHFGGHAAAAQAMREVGRVLKSGGVAAIATELVINDQPHPDFFTADELLECVIEPSGLCLIGTVDFSVSPELLKNPPKVDEVHRKPFLAIYWGNTLFASVMVFLAKGRIGHRV